MYGFIQGKIAWSDASTITIVTNSGLGLRVHVSSVVRGDCTFTDDEIELFLHTRTTQDNIAIYGFSTQAALELFELVLGVSGIGPKLALEITTLPVASLYQAIQQEDKKYLTAIKGLGKKTAERLILELKGSLPNLDDHESSSSTHRAFAVEQDVIVALENLGYKRDHITRVLEPAATEQMSESEMIKYFLQNV